MSFLYKGAASGCPCGNPCPITERSVVALAGNWSGSDADLATMISWMNSYDLTTVEWGFVLVGVFNNATDAAPSSSFNESQVGLTNGGIYGGPAQAFTACITMQYYAIGESAGSEPVAEPLLARTQVQTGGQKYCCIAWGQDTNGANIAINRESYILAGCIYPADGGGTGVNIIELPMPPLTFTADSTFRNLGYEIAVNQPLSYFLAPWSGDTQGPPYTGSYPTGYFSSNYNGSLICTLSPSTAPQDPFGGSP
jgi:hypothetical protein